MCSICQHSPCMPHCPNWEPRGIECSGCGEIMTVGSAYLSTDTGDYCEDCLIEMLPEELLTLVGVDMSVVEEEE